MKMLTRKRYYIIAGSIIGLIVLITIIRFMSAITQTKALTFSIPKDYLELFVDSIRADFKNKVTYNSKDHKTISTFDYTADYSIVVCQMNIKYSFTLTAISVGKPFKQRTSGVVYSVISLGYYDLKHDPYPYDSISNIDLSFNGTDFISLLKMTI